MSDYNQAQKLIDEANQNLVSNGFLNKLKTTLTPPVTNEPAAQLVYTALQTYSPLHMFTFASSTAESQLDNSYVMPASSLIFEVYSDNTIRGYYLDEPF